MVGVPARTVARVLRRHRMPYLRELDTMTGAPIRSSQTTAVRYERARPGELVHMDVKKLGRIPDGGGWRAHGRGSASNGQNRSIRVGFDYIHTLVDDHSRLEYSPDPPRREGCHLRRVPGSGDRLFDTARGIERVERFITDNAWAYRHSLRAVCAEHGIAVEVHQAALPLAERESRTVQPHLRRGVGLPTRLRPQHRTLRRPCALARGVQHSTPPQRTRRTPTHQPSVNNLMAGYI